MLRADSMRARETEPTLTIPLFSGHQDDVFIPSIVLVLVAALLIALPVVFAPLVRRMRAGRALVALLVAGAALAVIAAVVVAVPGFGTIAQQRATVQARIQSTYGLTLAPGDVARLVNGDTVTGLPGTPKGDRVRLAGTGHHVYILIGTPASSSRTLELPHS